MVLHNVQVKVVDEQHKGKIGHVKNVDENCFCATNSYEAAECECERVSEVYFDDANKTYFIPHTDLRFIKDNKIQKKGRLWL